MTFVNSPTKGSLMALLKDPSNMGAPEWRRLFDGVMFKDEFNRAITGQSGTLSGGGVSSDFSAYLRKDGSTALTNNWMAGPWYIEAKTFKSTVLTGTSPMTVSSTTKVDNLNADLLDGQHAAYFAPAADYLPLIAGSSWPLTGDLHFDSAGTPAISLFTAPSTSEQLIYLFSNRVTSLVPFWTDEIEETTTAAGVTIDGLLIKDANIPDVDYDFVSNNDSDTDVTGAQLEELTDGSDTTLHGHDVTGLTGWSGPYLELDGGSGSPITNDAQVHFGVSGGGTVQLFKFSNTNNFLIGDTTYPLWLYGSGSNPHYGASEYLALVSDLDDIDYDFVSGNDATTDVTGAELEELTDESTTTLHSHAVNQQIICFSSYIDKKERAAAWNFHGGLVSLDTGSPLDSVPTDITVTSGIGKLIVVVNAGTDLAGDITVTGTSVDRNTGAETASDTDTLTVDALTTDDSDTDAAGNTRHSFTGAYITSKWFKGSVTLSTTDLTLTDVDTYQVAFEQVNDNPDVEMTTADLTAYATNASAWMYGYLYTLEVTGDKCDIIRQGELELPAADVSANTLYRIRRGNLGVEFDGTTDGFWADVFPGPLANNYWEDINVKFWFAVGAGETTVTGYTISGTITGSPAISGVTVTLSGDASDATTTNSAGEYSFINVPNGSYTVTPTKSGLFFSPTSTAVTVSNGDQTGKDFTGYLSLPYSYNVSDVTPSSGAIAGQLTDWTIHTGKTDGEIITANLSDGNSFTPVAVTKAFELVWGGTQDGIIHDLPAAVDSSLTSLRVAFLAYSNESDRTISSYMYNVTAAEFNAGSPSVTGSLANYYNLTADTDENTSVAQYDSATIYNEFNAEDAGVNVDSNRYHWYRWEWDWVANEITISVLRDEDNVSIYSDTLAMDAVGQALGHVPTGLRTLELINLSGSTTTRVVKFWIGDTSDSWPTS